MFNIFVFIPLLFFMISSYFFNHNKLKGTKLNTILISLLEAIVSFLITFVFFLHGFIPTYTHLLIIFFVSIAVALVLFYIEKDLDNEWDLQIETIKNNLVLFLITLLPLYVFLTIFRYMDAYMQITLSFLLTFIIFGLSFLVKKISSSIFSKVKLHFIESGPVKYTLFGLTIIILIVMVIIFDLPTNKISQPLNLSNNIGFLKLDGFPKVINNHYYQNTLTQIELEDSMDSKITDYYCDQTHLYLYTTKGSLIVYELSTKEIVYTKQLGTNTQQDNLIYNKFTYFNGELLLLARSGSYLVTPDNTTKISDINSSNVRKYYDDNKLYFVKKSMPFEVYQFTNGELNLTETIDLSTTQYNGLQVISEHLFYIKDNQYIPHDNPNIAFDIYEGYRIYDKNQQIMYYTIADEELKDYTKYRKVDGNGNTSMITLSNTHNHRGIIIEDMIYFTEDFTNEYERVEIMNNQFEFESIFNYPLPQPFWIDNQIHAYTYIANYQENNNTLEFLQVDQLNDHDVLTVIHMEDRDVDLKLPFYAHYGLGIFIPIIIALFIPLSNYRKTITIIDFKYGLKQK